jgi:cytochrome c553
MITVNNDNQPNACVNRLLRVIAIAALLAPVLGMSIAHAAGDAAAGAEKSTTCAACHGAQGISQINTNPILAGQYPSYIEHALKSYRDGSRQNAIMAGFASTLSDQDIADLAAYFSSQTGPLQTAPRN